MKPLLLSAALLLPLSAHAQSYPEATSIVAIGGPVTEIVYALGEGDRLVARDTTSQFPPEAEALPDVGYMRQLSAEGVLSVGPDLILTRDTAGPPEVLDQLRAASIPLVPVKDGFSEASVIAAIHTVGEALGVPAKADSLATEIETQFDSLDQARTEAGTPPRVLFILSNQGGRLNVAGDGTGADGIIALTGAENVMSGAFQGYKIMSDEAIIAAAPDVVLMMDSTGQSEHDANKSDILDLPALSQTPAGQNHAFVQVAPAALGFGPRTAHFATELHNALWAAAE
ncbi:hemin ABC transporter substrate-binding protein [Celeribacter ethanolicus]|uniref:Hemin ABC transporter substrate-binding protein n=1 Tax=Celeribacter ethanolicus TaxID=1758178 RepID=A0A291GCI7_9RHOB|nr:ABC transporter substrate-binding protein [Celeribacter ethanolicus]ATG47752.1 hemin ABC transporter substrate-binding protein [Celeribacter ethanolicus]